MAAAAATSHSHLIRRRALGRVPVERGAKSRRKFSSVVVSSFDVCFAGRCRCRRRRPYERAELLCNYNLLLLSAAAAALTRAPPAGRAGEVNYARSAFGAVNQSGAAFGCLSVCPSVRPYAVLAHRAAEAECAREVQVGEVRQQVACLRVLSASSSRQQTRAKREPSATKLAYRLSSGSQVSSVQFGASGPADRPRLYRLIACAPANRCTRRLLPVRENRMDS